VLCCASLAKLHTTLQLWDIGGQSIGSKMITNYISGADAVLLCYDITNYESFVNLEDWYRMVLKTFRDKPLPYVALVGNKNDLRHMSAVRPDQHSRFADENEMASFLMSAKNGDQVKQVFYKVAGALVGALPSLSTSLESQLNNTVVSAVIIDHKRHDETVNAGEVPEYTKTNNNCSIS
jgi:Ras-related protein Rab-28